MANRDRFGQSRRDTGAMSPLSDFVATPFGMMRRMADEMNSMFNQGLGAARDMMPFGGGFPTVDVRETAGSYVVEADLPGVQAKDIDVSVQGDTLIIRGQTSRQQERQEQEQGYYMSERRFGSFHREIPLPAPVDEEKTTAHFENGVLEIRLPKTGQEQGRRIRVEGGQQGSESAGSQGAQNAQGGQSSQPGPGGTVPGTAERASQPGVEASTADQSYVGEGSGESAKDAAQAFQGGQSGNA